MVCLCLFEAKLTVFIAIATANLAASTMKNVKNTHLLFRTNFRDVHLFLLISELFPNLDHAGIK